MIFWCLVWLQVGTKDQFPVEWNSQRIIQQQKVCDQANGQKVAGNSDSIVTSFLYNHSHTVYEVSYLRPSLFFSKTFDYRFLVKKFCWNYRRAFFSSFSPETCASYLNVMCNISVCCYNYILNKDIQSMTNCDLNLLQVQCSVPCCQLLWHLTFLSIHLSVQSIHVYFSRSVITQN